MERDNEQTFYCDHGNGFSTYLISTTDHVNVRKRACKVMVEFANGTLEVETLEGKVLAKQGDAIVTGQIGERWPIDRQRFLSKYEPVEPTIDGQSGIYQTRPKRLLGLKMKGPFCVVLPDGVSRLNGSSGDWLIDYGDGSLGIVAARVFADSYEVIV